MLDRQELETVLDHVVRPVLQGHGGDARLVTHEAGVVQLELLGACSGCPSADLSTRAFIEEVLRGAFPEIRRVELVQEVDQELLAFALKLLGKDGTE